MWNWGKNRSNVAASQGRPIASSRQKPGRGEGGSFSRAFGMSLALTAPWFQISILHNYERTKLRYLKLLSLWSFVMAILGNQYSHIYQPPWQMHPGIWLVLALWNASPCALCTVRPNNTNTKTSDLQQGKVYCKAKQGNKWIMPSVQFSSVTQSCPTLCNPMNRSTPGLPVHHHLQESTQTHVHWVGDAIQPSYPLSSPSPPAFNLYQQQGLFQWVSSWKREQICGSK